MSSDSSNNIPFTAIILAVVSSLNSVGVSIYQEQLFKVKIVSSLGLTLFKHRSLIPKTSIQVTDSIMTLIISLFRTLEKIFWSSSSGCISMAWVLQGWFM